MQEYFERKSRLSGSVLMQSPESKISYQDEYFALKKKFEETIDNYELMIKEAINQIQQLELSMDDRTNQLRFAMEARDKYFDELSKKNSQIEDLSYMVSLKDKEIQYLKQRMQSGITETNNKFDVERQEHAHEVHELRKSLAIQQSELMSIQKQYSELESKSRRLRAKLKTHNENCKSTISNSQVKTETNFNHLLSLRKQNSKENQRPSVEKRPSLNTQTQEIPAPEIVLNNQMIKESDHHILAPVNLSEEMFEAMPRFNLSDLCRTPISDYPSPKIKKPKFNFRDSLANTKDILPLKEIKNGSRQSVRSDRRSSNSHRRSSNSHLKKRSFNSASSIELEQMIKRPGCKNLSCVCERNLRLPITSLGTRSSLCIALWSALKALAGNTLRLFSCDQGNQAACKTN